ncbi:glycosyltransferase family 10 domain-containing protein [Mucilaginibacter arboris]|uniref:Alpha-(1,3)-fucosyltransferase FucT N-terminal domain-containing protein n=1 Tax=Mucilaginibacter arboris TaxID=2682090 RepID=A0A7K1STM4_9SPHI|nr:glycosyltransferase family 10 [Mucilaginibacter arboris]MVN20624.1 hypothetical protein [Mucilaginibacter arboris]
MLKTVNIKFQNGLDFETAKAEILNELDDVFDFRESSQPDFIVFGPYGNDIPQKGNYTRIGYFCENVKPDFNCCEYAFGISREETINQENYKRIQWHGFDPKSLVKPIITDAEGILKNKSKFCNFLYSNPVPYREAFFKALNKYKKVDAPGKSMNNMPEIYQLNQTDKWTAKRSFLQQYKFTIAFENDLFPGYQTEKLYDAMLAGSIPIYLGDPYIGDIFNTKSFIHAREYLQLNQTPFINWVEKNCQQDFEDIRPEFYHSPYHRFKRHLKMRGRNIKMKLSFNKTDFSDLIDKIIELDKNQDLYLQYVVQPWLNNNMAKEVISTKNQWIKIFNSK